MALDEVRYPPPYGVEDCCSDRPNSQALGHVRKIVQKFLSNTQAAAASGAASPAPAAVTTIRKWME